MLTPGLTGPRSRSERLALQDARLRTNRSVAAVRAMWDGNLSGLSPGLREDWNSDWLQATPQQKEIVKRIFDTHRGAQPPPMAPRGADALRRILGSSSSWYGEQTSAGDHLGSPLPKGALCPLKVDEISVPSGVGSPIDPRLHSSTIAGYYEKAMELMVRSPTAVNHERLRGIVSYNDPNLAKGNTWLLSPYLKEQTAVVWAQGEPGGLDLRYGRYRWALCMLRVQRVSGLMQGKDKAWEIL